MADLNVQGFVDLLSTDLARRLSEEKEKMFGIQTIHAVEGGGKGGTDLSLLATQVDESIRWEMVAGWVSVLMAMKAAIDHGVDLRNHVASRTW